MMYYRSVFFLLLCYFNSLTQIPIMLNISVSDPKLNCKLMPAHQNLNIPIIKRKAIKITKTSVLFMKNQ